ncbi:MAG: hypothetical protein J5902_05945 [Paludibacteraceae bacterium]|nr:hypothetical protein [Paludibacteraceae bacterium]
MKKIFTTVIIACLSAVTALAVTVNDVSGVFNGTLNIGGDEYPNEEVYILPGVEANTITFVLPDFKFSGVSLGDIVLVNIPMDGEGTLTLDSRPLYIKIIQTRAEVSMLSGSQINGTNANVSLSIEAGLPEPISVVFAGKKVTDRNYVFHNAGFEDNWHTVGKGVEPDYWHSFNSGTGTFASSAANNTQLTESNDVHSGATGTKSALLQTRVVFGVKANGNLTNGQINAGAISASDGTKNYNFSDPNNTGFNTAFVGNPDSLVFWAKYIPVSGDNETIARTHATITTNAYYKDPESGDSYDNVKVAEATIEYGATGNTWKRLGTSFEYSKVDANQAAYVLINFTTNRTPGGGNASSSNPDKLYLDDVEIIYNHSLTSLTMNGTAVNFTNGAAKTDAEFSDSEYTFAATTNAKAAKTFIGYDAENNRVNVYVVANNYSQAGAYSVYTLQMAKPVPPIVDTEYAYSATTCDNEPYSDELFTNLTEAKTYTTTIPNTKGGDSIITLTLSVLPTYVVPAEATINMGESYTWQGTEYKDLLPGEYNYSVTKKTIVGCDSVLTLKLTVKPIPYYYEEAQNACQNEETEWHGKVLPTEQVGTFTVYDSLISVYGMDSVYKFTYTVNQTYRYEQTKYVNNADLVWRGQVIKDLPQAMEPYYYYDSLQTIYGCDSVYVLKLFVSDIPVTYGEYEVFVCDGEQVKFEGEKYSEAFYGEVRVSQPNIYGGDSIVRLTVTVLPTYVVDEYLTMTVGDEQYWEGWNLSSMTEGQYEMEASYYTINDCDSTIVLHLSVEPKPVYTGLSETETQSSRSVRKVIYNGRLYIIREDEKIYDILGKKIK